MKRFRIDFTQDNPCVDGCYIGRTGEHNATELIITPPAAMTENEAVTSYIIAFVTGGMLIHSEPFEKTETVHIKLWRQLTQNATIGIQLEAYDDAGDFIGKSEYIKSLKFLPSADGENVSADTDNPDLISEFLKIKHSHNNKETLDKFSEDDSGKPLYNGQSLGSGTGSGMTDEQAEELAKNTEARHLHNNKNVLDNLSKDPTANRVAYNGAVLGLKSEIPDSMTSADIGNAWFSNIKPIGAKYFGVDALMEQTEIIKNLISAVPKFAIAVVDALPETDISNTTVYLVKDTEADGNLYTEYIYVNNAWETLGSQNIDVDLTDYAKLEDVPNNKELLERFSYDVGSFDIVTFNGIPLANMLQVPTKTSDLENNSGFITKADIPTDESYEFIGQTPLTLENGGNIKLVADGEANYSIVSPTVWNFDNAELTLSNVELDASEGYYKFTVNNEAAKHTYCYAAFIISGLEVGRNYRFVFDTAGRTYDTANRIWTGSLTAYNGTSTAGGVAFAGKVLKNGNFDFTAADTSLYVRYVCAMNTTPYLGWVAHFNKMYLNYADTSEELTEIYSKSGAFTDIETFKSIPSGVIITTDPTTSVHRKAPTDKTLTQSDVPADAEVTGKEIAEVKSYLPLFGKTIVNFGDSIFGQAQPPNDVSTFLAEKTGATVYNCGFGGCRMSQHKTAEYNAFSMFNVASAVASGDFTLQENAVASTEVTLSDAIKANFARLKTVDFSKVDIITIAYSTNDWNGSVALDNEENLYDTTTIGGALRMSIELLLTAYPNARIFVLSTTWRFWHDDNSVYTEDSDTRTNSISLKLADYNVKLKEVAEEYNIPYVNDYNIGINKFNRSQYFSATDGTHHQIEGRKLIASHLAKEFY